MKSYTEIEDIVSKVQELAQIKKLLLKVLDDIESAMEKCKLWLEDKENFSYTEMKQYISDKASEALQKYITIAGNKIERIAGSSQSSEQAGIRNKDLALGFSTFSSSDNQILQENYDRLNSDVTLQNKHLKKLERKLKDQETKNKSIEEMTETLLKNMHVLEVKVLDFDKKFTQEHFMSELQTQCETLSTEFKENKELHDTKINVLSNKSEIIDQMHQDNSNKMEIILQKQDYLDNLHFVQALERISILEKDVLEVKENISKHSKKVMNFEREMKRKKMNEISEFFCKETGLSDFPCVADCPHIIGHHEQQISEGGEADLYNLLNDCYKNPDHANFIPVKSFRIEHLPPSYRNEDLYEFIKAAADLTVKVSVTLTSPERPEFWPNTNIPYFLFSMRGSKHLRTGSGNVINVRKEMKKKCPCEKCKISEKPNNIWWTVIVRTAASVIFDSLEAGHSVFRFFYDTEDSPEVVLKGVEYHLFKNISKDWCLFDCVTCDEKLVDKLNSMVKHYNYLSKKVNDKYKHTRDVDKIMFIVSHPHGCSKQLSLGQWKNKVKFKVDFNMLTYLTATCPGSSGACVHCLGYGAYVHCGSLASGHNYSNETISLLE